MFDNDDSVNPFCMKYNKMSDIDYGLLGAQVRAARALLGWSQVELINRTKCGRSTLIDFEAGRRRPHEATEFVILTALADAGVEFIENGVKLREWPIPSRKKASLPPAPGGKLNFTKLRSTRDN